MDTRALYNRMEATLFAWWEGLAGSSAGAHLVHLDGITAACFPAPVDREVFNNAVASRWSPPPPASLAALAALYARHGVGLWQLWIHEENHALATVAAAAGLALDTTTMAMALDLTAAGRELAPRAGVVPEPDAHDVRGLLPHADVLVPRLRRCGARLYALRHDGEMASCAVAFDHDGDRGIYVVETAERFRRHGLARALVTHALWEGREHGCTSASLQATTMAERVYASLGFRPMGLYVEWQYRGEPSR